MTIRSRQLAVVLLPVCMLAGILPLLGTSSASSAEVLTFTPTGDATIRSHRPDTPMGRAVSLRVDAGPTTDSLLKFNVNGLDQREVTGATLRLKVVDSSNLGGSIAGTASSGWAERTVTWSTAPAAGSPVASLGQVTGGSWYEADVSALVDGDGVVGVRISTTSDNGVSFAAKEAGVSVAPQLLVDAGDPSPDTSPPTVPGHLRALSVGSTSVGLAWDPSTDDDAVDSYEVLREGTTVATVAGDRPSMRDQDVQPDTTYQYSVRAVDASGNVSAATSDLQVTTPNGPDDPVLVGAGDIATCPGLADEDTAVLLDAVPGTVFTTGDNAYPDGSAQDFANCYDPSWGRHRSRTRPAVGNHEYHLPGANAYFGYFGAAAGDPAKGYYSYDVGSWHIVVLNSNCAKVGGCGAGSTQEQWLRADLAVTPKENIAAFWHHPWQTSSARGRYPETTPMWQALYDYGAEFVAVGHDHFYERFAPLDAFGNLDTDQGLRSFVVGSGGADLYDHPSRAPHSEVLAKTHGVLKLTLRPNSYEWSFLPTRGTAFSETVTRAVHGAPPPDVEPPDRPEDLSATTVNGGRVDLTWSAPSDNIGAVGYQIKRNGVNLPSLGNVRAYADRGVDVGQTYTYQVRAADARANWSAWSDPVTVTIPWPPDTLIVPLTGDAEILPSTPNQNYGTKHYWGVDGSSVVDSLLKADVTGVGTRSVLSARLHLTCVDPSTQGGKFYPTSGGWNEQTVTWASAPAASGSLLGSLANVVDGQEYVVDVTGHVTGDGTYALRASSPFSNGADYASSEAASGAPYLELRLSPE